MSHQSKNIGVVRKERPPIIMIKKSAIRFPANIQNKLFKNRVRPLFQLSIQ